MTLKKRYIFKELNSLKDFLKKPKEDRINENFLTKLRTFLIVFLLNVILLIILTFVFHLLYTIGFDDIFKYDSFSTIFKKKSYIFIISVMVFLIPVVEEILFRFHLKYRNKYVNLYFPLALIILFFISFGNITVAFIGIVLVILFYYIFFKKKLILNFKNLWSNNFKSIFYLTAIVFALFHIGNYDFTLTFFLLAPILILPQLIAGILIAYLRVRLGFLWGYLHHALSNAVLILPIIISLSLAFPSINVNGKEYELTVQKIGFRTKESKKRKFNKDSIVIYNCSFKECLSLLLEKEKQKIIFDESILLGGVPLLKSELLLKIKYKNKTIKEVSELKKRALEELQKAYKFKLKYNKDNVEVEF